ncbi:MAG: PpiC-type peptidyl-prolyl cis-trans isomerase [Acidimicrobiales bacterium]|nr:PpiC-type peptidyl-prolyl cis-trans isomerase [Acidimicrobiales bacterium]
MKRLFLGFLALVAIIAAGCGSLQPYAAIVNSHRIPQHDVDNELKAIRGNAKYLDAIDPSRRQILGSGTNTFNADFTAQILTRRIYYELVHDEVQRKHLAVSAKDVSDAKQAVASQFNGADVFNAFPTSYRNTLERRTAEVAVLGRSFTSTPADDAAQRAYFAAHQADFEQACASHILVDSKAKADAIEARLAKGEDFAAVAKTESSDTGSAQKGGAIGCFPRTAQLVPEFLQAAFAQPVGTPGPPVQTQFGFHVILVTSRKVPTFEEVKDQVAQAMNSGSEQKLTDWLKGALGKAKVKVNPKFGHFDKNQATPGVVPPQAPPSQTPTTIPAGIPGAPGAPSGSQTPGG